MIDRVKAAQVINYSAGIAALAVTWQAVRFCQGYIGAPVLDQFISLMNLIFKLPSATPGSGPMNQWFTPGLSWLAQAYYYLLGIVVWIALGALVSSLGSGAARIVEVGFKRYMAECKEAKEERRRFRTTSRPSAARTGRLSGLNKGKAMRDITAQVDDIHLQVTSEDNGEGGRTVQVHLTGPGDGSFKQQLDIQGDGVKWVSIPLKIIDGHVCIG